MTFQPTNPLSFPKDADERFTRLEGAISAVGDLLSLCEEPGVVDRNGLGYLFDLIAEECRATQHAVRGEMAELRASQKIAKPGKAA